jgi:hypothetical protein
MAGTAGMTKRKTPYLQLPVIFYLPGTDEQWKDFQSLSTAAFL